MEYDLLNLHAVWFEGREEGLLLLLIHMQKNKSLSAIAFPISPTHFRYCHTIVRVRMHNALCMYVLCFLGINVVLVWTALNRFWNAQIDPHPVAHFEFAFARNTPYIIQLSPHLAHTNHIISFSRLSEYPCDLITGDSRPSFLFDISRPSR